MIQNLSIILAQGLALHSACVEIFDLSVKVRKVEDTFTTYSRVNGELVEQSSKEEAPEMIINSIKFNVKAWVNINTREQGKPPFNVLTNDGQEYIIIDFDEHEQLAEFFDNGFGPGTTQLQKIEGVCEKYIEEILVPSLKA